MNLVMVNEMYLGIKALDSSPPPTRRRAIIIVSLLPILSERMPNTYEAKNRELM